MRGNSSYALGGMAWAAEDNVATRPIDDIAAFLA